MILTFDHIIAARNSYMSLPAAQEGIVPGFANLRLARFLGSRLAREMILCGRVLRATDTNATMLIDRVVEEAELDRAIDDAVATLDNSSVVANRRMLILAEEPEDRFLAYAAEFALQQSQRLFSRDVLDNIRRANGGGQEASAS